LKYVQVCDLDTGNAMDAVKEEIGMKIFFSNLEPIKHNEG
jgi:hypothetical protein